MSLIRTGILLAAVIMLLPAEERRQVELTHAAARTAEQTASFCDRNPSTCATGRELWGLFLRKAEYGLELGARLLRDQLLRGSTADAPSASPVQPPRHEPPQSQPRRSAYQMDHPSRWR